MPAIVADTLARHLLKHFAISNMHGKIEKDQLRDFVRTILEANQEKLYYSGQAPGNE